MKMRRYRVGPAENGLALLDFLSARLDASRRKAKHLIDSRSVCVNGKRIWMARHALRAGDEVAIPPPETVTAPPPPAAILYRDSDYVVVNKPAGILSNGPRSLEEELRTRLNLPALQAVHRLDRETSGCLLFAIAQAAFDRMLPLFAAHAVHKTYHAVVAGRIPGGRATIRRPLEGQEAVTHVREVSASAAATHVEIRIETGRTHQIRKHLAGLGHGVLGDRQYAGGQRLDPRVLALPRHMLHAAELEFPHPSGDRPVHALAPLPADFKECLKTFGLQ